MRSQPQAREFESSHLLLRRFKDFYLKLSPGTIKRLEEIYTQDIEFISPGARIQGSLGLKKHLKKTSILLENSRIDFKDSLIGENCAWLAWELEYRHPALQRGRRGVLRGMTHLLFTSSIYYQENIFDRSELLFEPLGLFNLYRKKRIFSAT